MKSNNNDDNDDQKTQKSRIGSKYTKIDQKSNRNDLELNRSNLKSTNDCIAVLGNGASRFGFGFQHRVQQGPKSINLNWNRVVEKKTNLSHVSSMSCKRV